MKLVNAVYTDPDAQEAEHLTAAAWHLIETGHNELAKKLTQRICELFENIEPEAKSKQPCKKLGKVTYFAVGIIQIPQHTCENSYQIRIPAPKYEIQKQDTKHQLTKSAKKLCQEAYIGWFPSRQVTAAITGKKISAATFQPDKTLKNIIALCDKFDDNMPLEAKEILSNTIAEIIEKCPFGSGKMTILNRDMMDKGGRRGDYDYMSDDYGFAWLSNSALQEAVKIIERDMPDAEGQLRLLPKHIIKWHGLSRTEYNAVIDALKIEPRNYKIRMPILGPFMQQCYAAYMDWAEHPYENEDKKFYGSAFDKLHNGLYVALPIAIVTWELQKAHAALNNPKNKAIYEQLKATGIIIHDLQIEPDLYKKAARCYMQKYNKPGVNPDVFQSAINAIDDILNLPDIKKACK